MTHRLLRDPWVAAKIDEALAPWLDVLPPDEIAWFRDRLAEELERERGARLLSNARPRVVDESGTVSSDPIEGNIRSKGKGQ